MSRPSQPEPPEHAHLTPAVFHILLALAGGERHGYAIMRVVAEDTGGTVRLGPGTLYRSIKQMLAAGLIEESDERPDPFLDDERRRYYRLTPLGEEVLQGEVTRLHRLVDLGLRRGLRGAVPKAPGGGL
jgi:DNA-binding PadR family transcriptional regulator